MLRRGPELAFCAWLSIKGFSSTCLPGKCSTEGPVLINCNGRRKGRELLSHHGYCEDALECVDAARVRKLFKDIVQGYCSLPGKRH